jgi:pheromone shutdown protein TraB
MSSIQEAPGRRIVGVVGAGHVQGMIGYLGQNVDRAALAVVPARTARSLALSWLIPGVVLVAFYFGYRMHSVAGLTDMIIAWSLSTSIGAAVFTLAAGGKWLTVLVAAVTSPVTALNPAIGTGTVAGLAEAALRKPTATDRENIQKDMLTLRGIHRNPFTRVLVVALASTVGTALGACIGAAWVLLML